MKQTSHEGVIQSIKNLEQMQALSKHEKIVQGVIDAIDTGTLTLQAGLPSVNTLIHRLGFARETIAKAYKDLMQRGIIASKNRKGYYVVSTNTDAQQKVALVLYAYDTFQDTLYANLRANVPANIQIDLYFHHNNTDVFEDIFNRIIGKYTIYVVAPIENKRTADLLRSLTPSKLLIIDRLMDLGAEYSFVSQEFAKSSARVFEELLPKVKKYKEMVFYFRDHTAEPSEIKEAFLTFLADNKIKGSVKGAYEYGELKKGKVYFTIHNPELYQMLKEVKEKGWELGKDLGMLSHNDDVIKEIISGGITTFSTDFAKMGKLSAHYIMTREKIREVIPTELVLRQSL